MSVSAILASATPPGTWGRDPTTVLLLRTVDAQHHSRGGFVWPTEVGTVVEAPDWDPTPECGHGLHGLLWGEGNGAMLSWDPTAVWQVIEADAAEVVDLGRKVKVPRCTLRYSGTREEATDYIRTHGATGAVHGSTVTAGDYGTATAGDYGTATAGDGGTATAGDYGTATAGYRGTATAGDYGAATAGYRGTATAGDYGAATAGDGGALVIRWWEDTRYRLCVGYVGEDGIEPNVSYRCNAGKLVRVTS